MTWWQAVLLGVVALGLYLACGAATARISSREIYADKLRWVRAEAFTINDYGAGRQVRCLEADEPLTDEHRVILGRAVRKALWATAALWPVFLTVGAYCWARDRRRARHGELSGWMAAGARAADAELAAARRALDVWTAEAADETATALQRQAARSMAADARKTVARLEGRTP